MRGVGRAVPDRLCYDLHFEHASRPGYDYLAFDYLHTPTSNGGSGSGFVFDLGSFTTAGMHHTLADPYADVTLTVTVRQDVPEPGMPGLFGLALVGLGLVRRRAKD